MIKSDIHTSMPKKGSVASRIASLQKNQTPSIPSPTSSFTYHRRNTTGTRTVTTSAIGRRNNPSHETTMDNMSTFRRHTTEGQLAVDSTATTGTCSTSTKKPILNTKSIAERIAAMKNSNLEEKKKTQAIRQNVPMGEKGSNGSSSGGGGKVATLAQNLKGLDVQAMLSGKNEKKNKNHFTTNTTSASISSTSNEECCMDSTSLQGEESSMDLHHVRRATIGRGKRRGRTFASVQGLKLSSEV